MADVALAVHGRWFAALLCIALLASGCAGDGAREQAAVTSSEASAVDSAVVVVAEESVPPRCGEPTPKSESAAAPVADTELSAELTEMLEPGVPGLIAATVDSEGLLRIGAAGLRAVDSDDPIQVTDRVHLASETKAMTATLLALLAEEGDIELTSRISDIWPEADAGWQDITLLDLLHHRGGAEDDLIEELPDVWTQLWQSHIQAYDGTPEQRAIGAFVDRANFATTFTSLPPTERVGDFAYSNAGYMLVGAAIEARTGDPWEELMCEHVLLPLAMHGCGFGAPPLPGAQGHIGPAGTLESANPNTAFADNPAALGPAGTVHCPMQDWGRFLSWVLRGARGEDDRLTAQTWHLLLEPAGDYAAGWNVAERPWSDGPVYTHSGSNSMWFVTAWLSPSLDRAFLTASNAGTAQAQSATDEGIGVLLDLDR